MRTGELTISDGTRIAVIGGGPAGAFFALRALKLSREKGINCTISIIDGKDFLRPGPSGCNMCAGVISETLCRRLEECGIEIPENVIQRKIEGYVFETVFLDYPLLHPYREKKIATVFRGGGPQHRADAAIESFDSFLLKLAEANGAGVIDALVQSIEPSGTKSGAIELACLRNGEDLTLMADVIVGAPGLNTVLSEKFSKLGFGYRPPESLKTAQVELEMEPERIRKTFKNQIVIFALGIENIRFAAMIPKERYVTLSLITRKDATVEDIAGFLSHPKVREKLPEGLDISSRRCLCLPKINVSSCKKPFTDRIVIIGDASISRFYKNGIESAFLSASLAAETIFHHGFSEQDFRRHYFQPLKKQIGNDNHYGHFLFGFFNMVSALEAPTRIFLLLASHPKEKRSAQIAQDILWNLFTGNISYKKILMSLFHPVLQLELMKAAISYPFRRKKSRSTPAGESSAASRISSGEHRMGPLQSGQTVAVLGGGPAGTGFAIALKNLAAWKGIDINVILYEAKRFAGGKHYNQCTGVLSPPIMDILENRLNIPFPHQLVQKVIDGYVLHSDSKKILLEGDDKPSYALRRITFDDHIMRIAAERGVEIVEARVSDVEFHSEGVQIYSDAGSSKADLLVGAFGIDEGSIALMEKATRYRAPGYLSTITTKIHPGEEFMKQFGTKIHAFLPSIREIEFCGIVPKANHLTVIIAGKDVTSHSMDKLFQHPEVRSVLPENLDETIRELHYYKGKFPTTLASHFYGDRYICIGDSAGLVRPFKGKGINSGLLTGYYAANVAVDYGISERAFMHFRKSIKEIENDLFYGRVLRIMTLVASNYKLLDPVLKLAEKEPSIKSALFHCVSSQKYFKEIFKESVSLRNVFKVLLSFISSLPT